MWLIDARMSVWLNVECAVHNEQPSERVEFKRSM